MDPNDFLVASCVPLDDGHASGKIDRARKILAANPAVAAANIYCASVLGDDVLVKQFLSEDPAKATEKGGPHNWDALTYLCFSQFLKADPSRSESFVRTAELLLKAGASANTGWFEKEHQPQPEWEPVLYGAAGIAHHPELTKLLLDWGADPNDGEVVYHTPETDDNRAMKLLLDTGKITEQNLLLMLVRKHDWHDYDGVKMLLDTGLDPNVKRNGGFTAMMHGVRRDNDAEIIQLLLDHGGDPTIGAMSSTPVSLAARRGRADLLSLFEKYGFSVQLEGVEKLIGACARDNKELIGTIKKQQPELVEQLLAEGPTLIAEFAGTANTAGVGNLLTLGVPITSLYEGDGYYGIPPGSMPLHVASCRAWHNTVKFLIEKGAPVNAKNGKGRTPLQLAVGAAIQSYWTYRRSTESIEALLKAGASLEGIPEVTGYDAADEILKNYR
jgi:ankyrin repeat protein